MDNFLTEMEAFDYLDAMWNDGAEHETLIEDHITGEFAPADEISGALQRTWAAIELLPTAEGGYPGDEWCELC